ncbi:MAG: amidohydrolase [Betaproteobacteria bacterium]|nr:amidohydrolase [Betaproteobacteria bacterium]
MNSTRRQVLAASLAGAVGAAALAAWRAFPDEGLLNPCGGPLPPELAGHRLVREAWEGLDATKVWDSHAHLFGAGGVDGVGGAAGEAGAGFNSAEGTLMWPIAIAQRAFFLNAACISGQGIDAAYVARLHALAGAMPAGCKLVLLALDRWHDQAGQAQPEHTHAWVGNDYCSAAAATAPARFEWAASVHPYRVDAVTELERVKRLRARAVKWIPSAQGIDPASKRCDVFYEALARLGLPLITHAGAERAASGDDNLGNPLRLRRALDNGVRVVVAHCASMGTGQDLDLGNKGPGLANFALFERLMGQTEYVGRLFGDLSAMTQRARAGAPLRQILELASGDWAGRLLNGSDYPVPGIMPLYSTRELAASGYLEEQAVAPLAAIRRHNPILYDFVLKRHLRVGRKRLPAGVFETRPFFEGQGKSIPSDQVQPVVLNTR